MANFYHPFLYSLPSILLLETYAVHAATKKHTKKGGKKRI